MGSSRRFLDDVVAAQLVEAFSHEFLQLPRLLRICAQALPSSESRMVARAAVQRNDSPVVDLRGLDPVPPHFYIFSRGRVQSRRDLPLGELFVVLGHLVVSAHREERLPVERRRQSVVFRNFGDPAIVADQFHVGRRLRLGLFQKVFVAGAGHRVGAEGGGEAEFAGSVVAQTHAGGVAHGASDGRLAESVVPLQIHDRTVSLRLASSVGGGVLCGQFEVLGGPLLSLGLNGKLGGPIDQVSVDDVLDGLLVPEQVPHHVRRLMELGLVLDFGQALVDRLAQRMASGQMQLRDLGGDFVALHCLLEVVAVKVLVGGPEVVVGYSFSQV